VILLLSSLSHSCPPTLTHLLPPLWLISVHSKIPPTRHNGCIPLTNCTGFLGSPQATETDAEIKFVTRESISFHFPGKKFHEKSIFPQKILILGKTSFCDREWPQLKNI